ncbi:hypothetical protein J6590_024277 [Homalodisca vitripennis]|nr:hypothetical protein J6590_024277 [Homalodisca vitripennis]
MFKKCNQDIQDIQKEVYISIYIPAMSPWKMGRPALSTSPLTVGRVEKSHLQASNSAQHYGIPTNSPTLTVTFPRRLDLSTKPSMRI